MAQGDIELNVAIYKPINLRSMEINKLTERILACAYYAVHTALGPGLLESAYEECLFYELKLAGLKVEKQKPLPLIYKEIRLDVGYRIDLLVEGKVIIENKVVEEFMDIHMAQVLTYPKLLGCMIGLLINFNVKSLKNGIKRLIY
jgi:GxxExxY protein